jgi:hypothetical protein
LLEVLPPAGVFTPRTLDGDFLLLAGGSGITPVFSILRSVLAQGQGRITLIYANRDERSVIFRRELTALAGAHPTRLMVIHWLDSVQGVPSVAQLAELAQPFRRGQAFICGPGPFMDACVAALQGIEMDASADPRRALRVAARRGRRRPRRRRAAAPVDGVDEAEVEMRLHQGQVHRLRCGGSETLLDAAMRSGIELPHSCQAGMCASCMCQVQEGQCAPAGQRRAGQEGPGQGLDAGLPGRTDQPPAAGAIRGIGQDDERPDPDAACRCPARRQRPTGERHLAAGCGRRASSTAMPCSTTPTSPAAARRSAAR